MLERGIPCLPHQEGCHLRELGGLGHLRHVSSSLPNQPSDSHRPQPTDDTTRPSRARRAPGGIPRRRRYPQVHSTGSPTTQGAPTAHILHPASRWR
eukprot:5741587-Pyramimonas_sp.AAC.1